MDFVYYFLKKAAVDMKVFLWSFLLADLLSREENRDHGVEVGMSLHGHIVEISRTKFTECFV